MSRSMVECMNCNALGRFDNGAVCPACDGAGEIEDDYTPTQLDRVEAKLDQVLAHLSATPSVTSTFSYTWDDAVKGCPKTPDEWLALSHRARPNEESRSK